MMVGLGCGPTTTPTIIALSCWTLTVIALRQYVMHRKYQWFLPRGRALPSEIQIVTGETRDAAIELLAGSSARKRSRRRCRALRRTSIECLPIRSVGARLQPTARWARNRLDGQHRVPHP